MGCSRQLTSVLPVVEEFLRSIQIELLHITDRAAQWVHASLSDVRFSEQLSKGLSPYG
jgi:hypothetical protein